MSDRSPGNVVSRWWHGAIAAVIVAALVIQLVLVFTGGADANTGESGTAIDVGTRLWRLFSFFTIQSNLIVLAVAVGLVLRPARGGSRWNVVRLDSLLGIVITGLVFAIVLAPQVHPTGAALAATIGFHYISPWTTLAAWLLLGPRPRITWRTVGTRSSGRSPGSSTSSPRAPSPTGTRTPSSTPRTSASPPPSATPASSSPSASSSPPS